MEFRTNYVVVGLFVLIAAAGALMAGLWLSAGFQNKTYDTYEIFMYEPVSGLNEQAPVKFNGVQVGFVKSISLNTKNPRQVVLMTSIEAGTPITKSTVATLMAQGITGVTYIGLKAKTPHADLLKKLPGQTYPIIPSAPSLLVEVDTAIRELGTNVDEISAAVKRVLSTENIQNFHEILSHTNNILKNLDEHSQSIIKNSDILIEKLSVSSQQLPATMTQFNTTLKSFNQASLDATEVFDETKYALRQWSSQVIPTTFSLVSEIGLLVADLEQITGELKEQPSLLIRGKTSPPLGPGEK